MLGVSLYTLRRWDKKGLIHSIRPDGNSRFFFITELQEIKSDQQYSISQAAAFLGLSPSTLRRLELRGLLCARRNVNKKRIYRQDDLKIYMKHREAK